MVKHGTVPKKKLSVAEEEDAVTCWKLAKANRLTATRDEVLQQFADGKLTDDLAAVWHGEPGQQQRAIRELCTAASAGLLQEAEAVMKQHPQLLPSSVCDISSAGAHPLHLAAAGGHVDIIRALLAADADVNVTNDYGETPLQVCGSAAFAWSSDATHAHCQTSSACQRWHCGTLTL